MEKGVGIFGFKLGISKIFIFSDQKDFIYFVSFVLKDEDKDNVFGFYKSRKCFYRFFKIFQENLLLFRGIIEVKNLYNVVGEDII